MSTLLCGLLSSSVFAPLFFVPSFIFFTILPYRIINAPNWKIAFKHGWIFGYGHFMSGLYWITIGVSTKMSEFWWVMPFSFFGLPAMCATYIGIAGALMWVVRSNIFFAQLFAAIWVMLEMLRSNILTGFPWNLMGYSLSFSDVLSQFASVGGMYALSLVIMYWIATVFHLLNQNYKTFAINLTFSLFIFVGMWNYGEVRLASHPTSYRNILVRLVQPSISQNQLWTDQAEHFWHNIEQHRYLSLYQRPDGLQPQLIIWPESAVTFPYRMKIFDVLKLIVHIPNSVLITGGLTDNNQRNLEQYKIYTSIYGLSYNNPMLFEYHKTHLLPFAEYMPFRSIHALKKITDGYLDYTSGENVANIFAINELNINVRPLVCYEVIFPDEVRLTHGYSDHGAADVIINTTNDAWYGQSAGPHQELYIAKMRAVENGVPLLRAANNGISAAFDPVGRIVIQSSLDDVTYLDTYMPNRLTENTFFSQNGNLLVFVYIAVLLFVAIATQYWRLQSR